MLQEVIRIVSLSCSLFKCCHKIPETVKTDGLDEKDWEMMDEAPKDDTIVI